MCSSNASAPIVISVGTRPEIIKMAPVYAELRRRALPVAWVHTGQHREMAESLYRLFDIVPDHEIRLVRASSLLAHLNAELLEGLSTLYAHVAPRAVLVHGDTTSTLASAQSAFYAGIPIGHVEAGLRTGNALEPFPEEKNRELTARLTRWHFAPTSGAAANLAREGIARDDIHTVGNTAIDAALTGRSRLDALLALGHPVLPERIDALRFGGDHLRLMLVTAHRRENWDGGIAATARAVVRLLAAHETLVVVWPVHGNPAVSETVHAVFRDAPAHLQTRIFLTPPLDYPALLWCLGRSALTLTDSGGIQEEGAALSVPVLVLRNTTERPELIEAGGGALVGTDEDHVVATVTGLLADDPALARMRDAINPFGDGRTSVRVADVLQRDLDL